MMMMRDPKMQEILKSVMTKGPEGIKRYLADPEALKLLQRLSITLEKVSKR
jgi:hypothetical protein